jgi:hypothetical protein
MIPGAVPLEPQDQSGRPSRRARASLGILSAWQRVGQAQEIRARLPMRND